MFEDIGRYKTSFGSMLKNDEKICTLLLGNNYYDKYDDLDTELDKLIIPHLYIEDVITEQKSYIMYEVVPTQSTSTIKNMKIIIQAICHKGIVVYNDKPKEESGLRYDVLSQYIENVACPKNLQNENLIKEKFGIGSFELKSPDLFLTKEFIGRTFTLIVPEFNNKK